jgi:hypothetical protein
MDKQVIVGTVSNDIIDLIKTEAVNPGNLLINCFKYIFDIDFSLYNDTNQLKPWLYCISEDLFFEFFDYCLEHFKADPIACQVLWLSYGPSPVLMKRNQYKLCIELKSEVK